MTQKRIEKEIKRENKRFFNTVNLERHYEKQYELKNKAKRELENITKAI
jgi:hypothetical protein